MSRLNNAIVVAFLFSCSAAFGQQFRGSITGTVNDPSGAPVPNVRVLARELATNTESSTRSNDQGEYTLPYLNPGNYSLTTEANGFNAHKIEQVEIRVGDKLTINIQLQLGDTSQSITIKGDATPLLDTVSASAGQVIDRRRLSELPLPDGNPFLLTRLAPGVVQSDPNSLRFNRPFDNGGTSASVADGAPGANEYTIDGIPNTGAFNNQVAFVPPADAVQEFRVVTSSFDAQQGHSAGAQIEVAMRSGTNRVSGSLYAFNRNDILSGNNFFTNANPASPRDSNGKAKRDPLRYNRYGGTVGGPVLIPKLYDGRDKTFFFFAYEGLRQVTPATETYTVPTATQRTGDFSALLAQNIRIYDPSTARVTGDGHVERTPFEGNIIPRDRISQIGQKYLSYYPLPNQPGDAQGRNNLVVANPRVDYYGSESVRVDHTFTESNRMFVRYTHGKRRQNTKGFTGEINGVDTTGLNTFRVNNGAAFDDIWTISPSTIFNFRAGLTRFENYGTRNSEGVFDPATLGFPSATLPYFEGAQYFPRFDISNFAALSDSLIQFTAFDIYTFQPTVTKLVRDHTIKAGYDFRVYRVNEYPSRHAAGRYEFAAANVLTRQRDDSAVAPIGQELAAVLLGLPSGGQIDRNATRNNQMLYHGLFFQDDWRISRKLTLNLGLRYEFEGAPTERYNRNIRGFDTTAASPIEQAARAAYAPIQQAQVPLSQFQIRGGLQFVDQTNPSFYQADKNNFLPRLGFAYQVTSKTVLRGGFAMYAAPFYIDSSNQTGFSQATQIVPTLDAGLTLRATLANPFPEGVLAAPGATQGLSTFLGRSISFVPSTRKNAISRRYELMLQRELPGNFLVEAGFIRSGNTNLAASFELNPIPAQYLTRLNQRDPAVDNILLAQVSNPFAGLLPGTNFNGATVARQQLLRPFPQFDSISTFNYDGSSYYNSGQFRVERRFSQGFTINATYTFSKLIEQTSLRNPTDTSYEKRISRNDFPHRVTINGVYEIPVGRGRPFGRNMNRWLDAIFGGYQVQGIYQYQSGRPLDIPNIAFYGGDPSQLSTDIDSSTVGPNNRVFDVAGFSSPGVDNRLRNNIRTLPTRLSSFRSQPIPNLDASILKNFAITEGIRLQLRGEFLNATNTPLFGEPTLDPQNSNFGRSLSQVNLPRNVQIGLRLVF